MSLIVSASQRHSVTVTVSMIVMGAGLGCLAVAVKGEATPPVSWRGAGGAHGGRGIGRHQRGALGVVPQLPKRCWVVRVGRS